MNLQMARFKVKPESVVEFEAAATRIFEALQQTVPAGVRYISCRLSDGVTYQALLKLDDGVENPLPELPEGKAFLDNLRNWIAEPPIRDQLTVIGSYRFF